MARYNNTVAHTRSLLFSYIEGGHLPHYQFRRIEVALEMLHRDYPEEAEALSRFYEQEDKADRKGEETAVKRLSECLSNSYLEERVNGKA